MKQTVVTAYVFNASAQTLDLGTIVGFNVKRLYAVINLTASQVIYAAGIPAYGYSNLTGTVLTLTFNTTAMSNTDQLEIIYDTVNTDLANAWVTKLTDGTNTQSYTGAGEAKVSVTQPLPAGANNLGSITNITGTQTLPTNAAQETGGHLASLDAKFSSLGQKTSASSAPVVIASDQTSIPVTLTSSSIEIGKVDQGTAGSNAQAWWVQLGDTTHGPVAVKAASTPAAATDLSLVVSLSPNSPLPAGANVLGGVTQNGTWTVQQGGAPWSVSQSGAWTTGRTWTLSSGTDSVAAVQSGTWNITNISGTISLPTGAATAANQTSVIGSASGGTAAASSLLSGGIFNTVLPTLTNGQQAAIQLDSSGRAIIAPLTSSSTVTVNQGTSPWVGNITQFGGTNLSTGTGASGAGIPRVTVANDSNILATQSGTWNITNISGTISLPTGASSAANQTNGTQKTQIVDGSGNVIGGATIISGTNYLPVTDPSIGTTGSAVAARTTQVGGSDGTNLRTFATDTSGNQNVVGSVAAGSADSGNPVKIGGKFNTTQPTLTNGQRGDAQMSVFGDLTTADNTKYQNIAAASTTTIKSGAGLLYRILFNNAVNNATITIYDNTAASGTKIGTVTQSVGGGVYQPVGTFDYGGVNFSTGLTIVTSGATDITVCYK